MSIPFQTEPIMAALFALGQGVGKNPATPLKIASRRFMHYKDLNDGQFPAFYQQQLAGRKIEGGVRGLPVHRLYVRWVVYLPSSKGPNDIVSPIMNKYYDAFSQALRSTVTVPRGTSINTLGGLCANCYEDGVGLNDEGLLATPTLIVIPITILTAL